MPEVNEQTNLDQFKVGKYETREFVGYSSTGLIYKAVEEETGKTFAVKVLKHELGKHEKFMQCLKEEMEFVSQLSHPNIVKVKEVDTDKDKSFIVLEYVNGKNLKEILEEKNKFSVQECIDFMKQLALALDYSQEKNIVHKSIKPQSILISNDGKIKLTGFGISRALATAWLTLTGTSNAQVEYMSPEQAEGEEVGHPSDIYSFGIIAYQMLTGDVPFKRERSASILSVAMRHINEMPVPLKEKNAEIPEWLDQIILKCLEKKPSSRYSRGKEIFDALSNGENSDDTNVSTSSNDKKENNNKVDDEQFLLSTPEERRVRIQEIQPGIQPSTKNITVTKETLTNTNSLLDEEKKQLLENAQAARKKPPSAPPPPPPPPKMQTKATTRPLNAELVIEKEEVKPVSTSSSKNYLNMILIAALFVCIMIIFYLLFNQKP